MARSADTTHSWHALENVVPADASFEVWLDRSGMGFQIESSPVEYAARNSKLKLMKSRRVLYRGDTDAPLSVVSTGYQIVQPRQVLSFFTDLCKKNDLMMDTAGVIQGGKKFWALARTGLQFNIGKDIVKDYILLASSCDGSLATTGKHTSLRVVCSNTFHLSMGMKEEGIKINHSEIFDASKMAIDLGITTEEFNEFSDMAQTMHKRRLNDIEAGYAYASLVTKTEVDDADVVDEVLRTSRQMQNIWGSYKDGAGAENTVWGWFNGVTHMVDNKSARNQDGRINNSLFGMGSVLKQRAWTKAKEMVGA
jgi:phage/plasmid-like protein (TIGR03299 family)